MLFFWMNSTQRHPLSLTAHCNQWHAYAHTCTYLPQKTRLPIVINWTKDVKSQEIARGRCRKPLGPAGIRNSLDQCYNKWDRHDATRKGSIKHWLRLLNNKAIDHERVAYRGNSARKGTLRWTEVFGRVTVLAGLKCHINLLGL